MRREPGCRSLTCAVFGCVSIAALLVQPAAGRQRFTDIAESSGIVFEHRNGASPEKFLPETMSAGALIFDYDNDGWQDVLFTQGGSFMDTAPAANPRPSLYRNLGDGSFENTTEKSGLRHSGYGMGACSADVDNDGWPDIYLTSVGENRLFRNSGRGSFIDVTVMAGAGFDGWSASCAFGDVDNDGDVDLYVANYVDFDASDNRFCGDNEGVRRYCHPNAFDALPDILYRNNGDGTFDDFSRDAGIATGSAYGLGVVFTDYDNDGWIDIYVANDSMTNFLFHNQGHGIFTEVALLAGVSVGGDGLPQAGMGTDSGDIDGDGMPDLIVTNLDRETHSVYRNLGDGLFSDITFPSGVGRATLPFVGFGVSFLDIDNDGDLDLVIANGGIFDNADRFRDTTTYRQPNLILRNEGDGKFEDAVEEAGAAFDIRKVSRGLAAGDIDNDGDLDLVVSNNGERANVLRNDRDHRNDSLVVRVVGTTSNASGIGTRLVLRAGDRTMHREIKGGSGYLGQNDLRAHFGMGAYGGAERLEIHWPGGTTEVFDDLPSNRVLTFVQGRGMTDSQPFASGN